MTLPFHPYAEMFELIGGSDFSELVDDIGRHGLREKITVLDDQILDGRNRYLAAIAAGLIKDDDTPTDRPIFFHRFVPDDGDPLSYVVSKNIHRRHLTTGQRAYAMAEYETFRHGGARQPSVQDAKLQLEPTPASPQETRAELADKGHVSERSIASAAVVRDHGIDDLKAAVKQAVLPPSVAEKIARLPEQEQPQALAKVLPRGARAIMGSRQEPDDSLDYAPTPPWGTRSLIKIVLPQIGISEVSDAWEPACGEGHIAEVLIDHGARVIASDVHDYGYGEAPINFLSDHPRPETPRAEWIITNPPFKDAEKFALLALERAQVGVAMFVRWQWIETVGRFNRLFKPFPPTLVAVFAERIPLHMGRWEPDGDTATAYCWIVWHKLSPSWGMGLPTLLSWIPPGQREVLTHPDDRDRFTAHPVKPYTPHDPTTGEIPCSPKKEDGRTEPAPSVTAVSAGAGSPAIGGTSET